MTRMTDTHPIWLDDTREIVGVRLSGGDSYASTYSRFERFERNGEMAFIPWLRIIGSQHDSLIREAPLSSVECISFRPSEE